MRDFLQLGSNEDKMRNFKDLFLSSRKKRGQQLLLLAFSYACACGEFSEERLLNTLSQEDGLRLCDTFGAASVEIPCSFVAVRAGFFERRVSSVEIAEELCRRSAEACRASDSLNTAPIHCRGSSVRSECDSTISELRLCVEGQRRNIQKKILDRYTEVELLCSEEIGRFPADELGEAPNECLELLEQCRDALFRDLEPEKWL